MNTLEIFLPIDPPRATQQEKKINWKTKRVYQSSQSRDAKEKLRAYLVKYIPDKPLDPPVSMEVVWCFPEKGKHKSGDMMTVKPDLDNLQKALQDVMTDLGFYKDDAQICALHVMKVYTKDPGIMIRIRTFENTIDEILTKEVNDD